MTIITESADEKCPSCEGQMELVHTYLSGTTLQQVERWEREGKMQERATMVSAKCSECGWVERRKG